MVSFYSCVLGQVSGYLLWAELSGNRLCAEEELWAGTFSGGTPATAAVGHGAGAKGTGLVPRVLQNRAEPAGA